MIKIKEYPDFRKSGAAVINVNSSEYRRALKRKENEKKIEELDKEVRSLNMKLDMILEKLNVPTNI